MKKYYVLAGILVLALSLCSCGVSQEDFSALENDYTALENSYTTLQDNYDALEYDYTVLEDDYAELVEQTADWLLLSEEEKETERLTAEANRIAAEAALEEEQEAQAEAERLAAEQAAIEAAEEEARQAEAEKIGYETGITFDDLSRNPDDYVNQKVKFKGEVLQVTEVGTEVQIRLATKAASYGGYNDDVIYIYFDSSLISSRLLEDDIITIYGVSKNLYTYETIMGGSVTLPLISVDKLELH